MKFYTNFLRLRLVAPSFSLLFKKFISDDSTDVSRIDHKKCKLPDHVSYLIIGSGASGLAAFRAIKGLDAEAKVGQLLPAVNLGFSCLVTCEHFSQVLVIGEEPYLPYMRPPLSKELWQAEDADRRSLKYKAWNSKMKRFSSV